MVTADLRYGVRALSRTPLFAVAAVLSLGLGIGVNSAMFSLFNNLLWRPLPVRDPASLVMFYSQMQNQSDYGAFSFPDYRDYASQDVADDLAAFVGWPFALGNTGEASVRLFGECVSGNYFEMLKPRMYLGRGLRPDEGTEMGREPVAVLGYRAWRHYFDGDPWILGRSITLNGLPYTVVGIAAPEFHGVSSVLITSDVWVPITMLTRLNPVYANHIDRRTERDFLMIGRLRPGTGVEQARAAAQTVAARLAAAYPDTNRGLRVQVFRELDTRPFIGVASAAKVLAAGFLSLTILVLLIACANVATLLLSRVGARQRELAMRVALGASRGVLVRQLLAESFLLSVVAGLVGLFVGFGATRMLGLLPLPPELPLVLEGPVDWRVVLFTAGISLVAGVVFGLVPALRASRPDLVPALKGAESGAGPRRRFTLNRALVVGQVAASLLLLVLAGLFLRSINGARTIDPGFSTDNRVVVDVDPSLAGYSGDRSASFYRTLLARARRLPGVASATIACGYPFGLSARSAEVAVEGRIVAPGDEKLEVVMAIVDDEYFATFGTRVTRGRPIDAHDTATSRPVVMVNETFARRYWPGQNNVIGKRVQSDAPTGPWMEVVGVAADGKYRDLGEPPTPAIFVPYTQHQRSDMSLVVATRPGSPGLSAALQREVKAIDPTVPIFSVRTMEQHMDRATVVPRLLASLVVPAGLLAVVIAIVGLYAVMAHSVGRRTREIGVRVAIGAAPLGVLKLVLREGVALTLLGVGIGLAAAFGASRLVAGLLLGVTPNDPVTFVAIPALLVLVAIVACCLPARRALRVDPLVALRQE